MIDSLFGSNRPLVLSLLIIPAIGFGILAFYFATPMVIDHSSPAFKLLAEILPGFGSKLIAGIIVNFSSAVLVNRLYNQHTYARDENYYPALFYFLISSLHLPWIFINPVMLGNLFILLALRRLLSMYRVQEVTSMIFDAGVFLGIGTLLFPPAILAVPLLWLSLSQLRTFNFREWLVPITGLALPAIYALVYFWWFDLEFYFTDYFLFGEAPFQSFLASGSVLFYLVLATTVFIVLAGLSLFFKEMGISTVHKKNTKKVFITLTVLLILVWGAGFWLEGHYTGLTLILTIPAAVFSGVFFSGAKRKRLRVTIFYIWLILLLLYPIFTAVI